MIAEPVARPPAVDYTEPLHAACRAVSPDYDALPPMGQYALGQQLLPAVAAAVDQAAVEACQRINDVEAVLHTEAARTGRCVSPDLLAGLHRACEAVWGAR